MNTQELFEKAKEDLLKDGKQSAPIMYVEFTDTDGKEALAMFYFADFGARTAIEEHMHMFGLGMQWGEEQGKVEVAQLALISEAWTVTLEKDEKRTWKRPHEAPNRREALVMHLVEVQPTPSGKPKMKQSIKHAEILRHGGIVDLAEVKTDDLAIVSLTLPAYFLSGYAASQSTPEELDAVLQEARDLARERGML